jgi:hypothetical protein
MAEDAFGRGDRQLAEVMVARANQYADEAVARVIQQQQRSQLQV